jgi:hypothetical protein
MSRLLCQDCGGFFETWTPEVRRGGAADDNAVTKAWGVLSLRDMTFYINLVIAPPPGAVDELEPPHQIPVRARPKLDAFCALRPSHVCKCKGVWPHESCHWAVSGWSYVKYCTISGRAPHAAATCNVVYRKAFLRHEIHCGWTAHRVWMIQGGGCP